MDLPTLAQLAPQILVALVIIGGVIWLRKSTANGKAPASAADIRALGEVVGKVESATADNGKAIAKLHTKVATIATDVSWLKTESAAPPAPGGE